MYSPFLSRNTITNTLHNQIETGQKIKVTNHDAHGLREVSRTNTILVRSCENSIPSFTLQSAYYHWHHLENQARHTIFKNKTKNDPNPHNMK